MAKKLHLPALDPAKVKPRTGCNYPDMFAGPVKAREKHVIGDALGLTQFGVNVVRLKPGVMSAQRHWHSREDEFVIVLEGELALVTESGEQMLGPGMAAGQGRGLPGSRRPRSRGRRRLSGHRPDTPEEGRQARLLPQGRHALLRAAEERP